MSLDYKGLISNSSYNHTLKVLGNTNSEKLTYYIDNSQKWNYIDRYLNESGEYSILENYFHIYTNKHDRIKKKYIRSIFNKLDPLIDLDFEEMNHNNGSLIDIYSVLSSSSMQSNVVGQAIEQEGKSGSWWDIIWKKNEKIQDFEKYEQNTIIHEIGHTLGLSHPFESPFNELWNSSDTIMSYNVGPDGWNTWFSESDLKALKSLWGRENDNGVLNIINDIETSRYTRNEQKVISLVTETGLEDLSDILQIRFNNSTVNVEHDINQVFDLIDGVDDITGKIYRIYQSVFDRFPDIEGFKYWIDMNKSGENTFKQTCASFIQSKEFINLYGENNTNDDYIKNLYKNVLHRTPDLVGFNYWLNQLNNNIESRSDLLIGFSESEENKLIFADSTGINLI